MSIVLTHIAYFIKECQFIKIFLLENILLYKSYILCKYIHYLVYPLSSNKHILLQGYETYVLSSAA